MRFRRPDHILQPVHQRQIVRITAEKRHCHMRVGIDQAGQSQHAFPVNDFIRRNPFHIFRKRADPHPFDQDIFPFLYFSAAVQSHIFYQHRHTFLLYSWLR